jgi:hypothetical protein
MYYNVFSNTKYWQNGIGDKAGEERLIFSEQVQNLIFLPEKQQT